MVAAAQVRPVGDSATARDRTAGRRLPPVPGKSSAPAGPPVAPSVQQHSWSPEPVCGLFSAWDRAS